MKRLLSLVLSLSLLLTMSTGFADKNEAPSASKDVIENIALPDIIEAEEAEENKYVGRLAAMEQDLSTFVFANEDGTQTLRMFSHPVKYVDEEGKTKDITLEIAPAENGAFKTKDNSIITTFEKKLADGISLEYDDIDLLLKPTTASALSVASSDGETVTYPYGRNTKIEYSLTYTGFKEDIVVEQYTGQTEYEFTLYTNGLKVEKIGETYKVVDGEGNIKANIGDIIIFTADERNNTFGELTCETVKENEEYLLTIHIDADYLSDPKTAYPIRIDPTLEINYSGSGETAIQDVTINSTGGSDGSSGSLRVGKRETYGISRILMKFPGLSAYASSNSQILSATVEIRDIMCESDALTVYCYQFAGNTWSESTTNWSNVNPSSIGSLLSSNTVSYANGVTQETYHRYSFDITSAVTTWGSDYNAYYKGIIFKASSSVENGSAYISKTFSSYERSSNQPSLTIMYNDITTYSVNITASMDYVMVGKTKAISYTTTPSGLNLTWTSSDTSVATVNSSGVVTGVGRGSAYIYASYYDSATSTSRADCICIYVLDSEGISDNTTYFVMNSSRMEFMSIEEGITGTGTNVYTTTRNSTASCKWTTEKQSDGKYQLISEYFGPETVLTVTGTTTKAVVDTDAATSKFDICRLDYAEKNGLYVIIYGSYFLARNPDDYVYLSSSISSDALWSFMAVEKGDADIFSFDFYFMEGTEQKYFTTTGNNNYFVSTFSNAGYDAQATINPTATIAYQDLRYNDNVFVSMGHGNGGIIGFNNANGEAQGSITVNASVASYYKFGSDWKYIDSCPDNSLSQLKIVLYLGCLTATDVTINGKTYNLVEATYDKGAHFVLGTTETLVTTQIDEWLNYFLDAITECGCNVGDAIDYAQTNCGEIVWEEEINNTVITHEYPEFPAYKVGDDNQYLTY